MDIDDSEVDLSTSDEEVSGIQETTKLNSNKKRKYENIPSGAPKKHKNDLYKPPTVEELNSLRETEDLFNNNLYRLQITELLNEIQIKTKRKVKLSVWLEKFKNSLLKLPEKHNQLHSKLKKRFKLDKVTFKTDQDLTLQFLKPESVNYFGLYENNALTGPNIILNINLTIPKNSFLQKDYLNNRYIIKRYYYLLYIADYLEKCDLVSEINLDFYENNHLLPIINLIPKDCDKTNILIFATPPEGLFKPTRFLPEKNNLKVNLFNSKADEDLIKSTPTVFYNSLLAHDVSLLTNIEFLKSVIKDQNNIQDGIKLLCIWLKQRNLNVGLGAFTESLICYIIAYLVKEKKINKVMSSYQIIRNFWNFLSSTDLQIDYISIGETTKDILNSFKDHDVVVLDKTGCYNVASFLSAEIYKKVKTESKIALTYLDSNQNNSFQELFLTKYPFHLQYDVIIDLTKSLPLKNQLSTLEEQCRYQGYNNILLSKIIKKFLKLGLNNRVTDIVPQIHTHGENITRFLLGVNLNPDEAYKILEKGPALNDFQRANEFRTFWGHLASDRRFKDGSTNTAVYFKTNTIKGKRNIVKKIIEFIFEEKLKLEYKIYYNELEDVLVHKRLLPLYPNGTDEETSLKVILAADELSKLLRELNFSLKITGVQGVSDVFTYSDVCPPIPEGFEETPKLTTVKGNNLIFDKNTEKVPRYVQPVNSILQLEHSSKWPNNIEALKHIKTSFYIEISKLLQTKHALLTNPTRDYLDVYFQGIVFRYRLFVPKEISLIKKVETENGLTSFSESEKSLNLEIDLNIIPKIMSALKGIQSQYPCYGTGVALVKRWLRVHLIDEYHFPDVIINLLNAYFYVNYNSNTPNTPQLLFLRFLKFMSELDWNLNIIVVNFNKDLNNEEILNIESVIQSKRNSYPNLFILTPYDHFSTITRNSPSKEILNRIKQLALECLILFDRVVMENLPFSVKNMFQTNYNGFNVLIHLKSTANSRRYQKVAFSTPDDRKFINKYKHSDKHKIPIVDIDPVKEYVGLLRSNYGKFAVFLYDQYGGNVIGVLWYPGVHNASDFKVAKVNACKIVNKKMIFNVDAVIEDFYILGKGLVKSIEKK